jgi:hypothetical protein
MRAAIWTGLLFRLFVAIWNGFFGPSYGADLDALSFHLLAAEYARNPKLDDLQIVWTYTYVLGFFYYLTTDSLFLGSFLSCLTWLVSAYVLIKIMRLLSVDISHQFKAMLIYALLPSSIMMTGITLREPFQLFFVNLAIYAALKIYLKKSSVHWFILFFAVTGMGVLHGALMVFGLSIIVAIMILLGLRGRNGFSLVTFTYFAPLIALILIYGISFFTSVAYNLDDGLGVAVENFQQGALGTDARANYKDNVGINGFSGLLLFIPSSLFQYLFEPMPWRISTAADMVLLLENILRAWLICKALIGLLNMPVQGRRPVIFIFFCYLALETIWSLGTINWGTAMRHHLPSTGLLVIVAFVYSSQKKGVQVKSRAKKSVAVWQ